MNALVSTGWLAERLGDPRVRPVDASWYLPAAGRNARAEYATAHVPGAVYFDLDAVSDRTSSLPHMLPGAAEFAAAMGALGLSDDDLLVVYDGSGTNLSAARAWWMFRAFGHEQVALLDGGIGKWRDEGRPVESGTVSLPPRQFTARLDAARVRDLAAMQRIVETRGEQVLDARASARFEGTAPEPRPGLRSGHIPGSLNLPYTELVAPEGTLLPVDELRRRFEAAGVDLSRPIVTTCGSGVTACTLLHALHLLGHRDSALYDGSWTEWGAPGPRA